MKRFIQLVLLVLSLGILFYFVFDEYFGSRTIEDLLKDNRKLKKAVSSLMQEDQIGFAKVIRQEKRDGRLYTTLRFVETARNDLLNQVLEREYEIAGDIIHFDALIVQFSEQIVLDGKKRSLYLWRRVYGEKMNPSDGFPIESPGMQPERYVDLLNEMGVKNKRLFWESIWQLSNNPDALQDLGIKAIYGNVVYQKLKPGLIYIFKIGSKGSVYPETVLDM